MPITSRQVRRRRRRRRSRRSARRARTGCGARSRWRPGRSATSLSTLLHVADHRHRGVGQHLVVAGEGRARRHRQQVGAERVDRRPAGWPGWRRTRRRRRPSRRSRSRSPAPTARPAAGACAAPAARRRTARAAAGARSRCGAPAGRRSGGGAHRRSSPTISPSRIWIRRGKAAGDLGIVGDQHQRGAVGGQLVQQLDHLGAGLGVEVAGRLVGEDDQRPLGQRAGDRHALALAAGQLRWPVGEPVAEPDSLERGPRRLPALARARAGVEHAGGDVVDRGHRLLEVEGLEHEADPVGAQAGQLAVGGRRRRRGRPPRTSPRGRPLERAEDGQHRRLARARRPDHRHLVAGGDLDADAAQRRHAAGVLLDDAVERQRHGRLAAHPCESVTCRPG